MKKLFGLILTLVAVLAVVSCTPTDKPDQPQEQEKVYTYNTYTTISPTNWNELTYKDNNDTQIMSYIGSSFFQFDYKFDANGQIVPGEYEVEYAAATKLEDVSAQYAGEEWGIPEGAQYHAYKITLRSDLKWDDGTAITAHDFVYTMEQQLDPKFQNYRADSFYVGSTIIHNALQYVKQGQPDWFAADTIYSEYVPAEQDDKIIFRLGPAAGEVTAEASFRGAMGFPASYDAAKTAAYIGNNYGVGFNYAVVAEMEGKSMAEIKANEAYKAEWDKLIGWWQTEPNEELDFFVTYAAFPEMSFDKVGIFVGDNDYELVICLDKALPLLKEDGSLDYKAAYNFSSLPLVKRDKYEANKVAPVEGSVLWTSTYNSDVNTTASWGPYRLTSFQTGKQYILEKNPNWFGYSDPQYAGQYQTDRIVCDTIGEWGTAWLQFQKGNIDGIGIDVTIADDYKGSDRAYFTPDDFVNSLQLQSNVEELAKRESEGVNKTILGYQDFRKALSLSIDRAEFARKTTTSSLAGFGLFNSMHYYDVANGKAYRNEDVAKQVLCDVYGVKVSDYASLDEAYQSITGYNLKLAKELLEKAYAQAKNDGKISDADKVVLTLGTGAINETVTRRFDFIKASWVELAKGTSLEGRIEFEVEDFADAWADDFRAGKYDVCMGGWSGAAWDPGYFLLAYLSPSYMYSTAWDTSSAQMTFTMPGVGENGEDVTDTMSLMEWYDCLNSNSGCRYAWGAGDLEESKRLLLIAALEKEVLTVYYTVPLYNSYAASLLSYKVEYISYEYNTFMAYGGIRYMTFNYSDAEWKVAVEKEGGILNYK